MSERRAAVLAIGLVDGPFLDQIGHTMEPNDHRAPSPVQIPAEWDDTSLLTFEVFCDLIRTPQRTVRDWRRRGVGPRWGRLEGTGRLYLTVAEARRFLTSATTTTAPVTRPTTRPTQRPTAGVAAGSAGVAS